MTAQCHREVADRDGMACPCDRPAVGLCPDFDGGSPYPVCRRHLPTDAEMDEYVLEQRTRGASPRCVRCHKRFDMAIIRERRADAE